MVFLQCFLTGTALSWYIRLNDTYKQDWHAFVQAFKKQFSSQKNAYYAKVEALNLSKKDNETVRHFALKVQQLVEKGWCNENASTINLKCSETFTKGLPENLKDFANKRQVKHTSTLLEPTIPFHTLVKLVDAEEIANDKIRTHDLALEVNNFTKQLNTQTLEPSSQEQLMFTQPKDPNNKNKPAYKKYCSYCHRTNHTISACFKKQRDDEDKRDAYARSKSPKTLTKLLDIRPNQTSDIGPHHTSKTLAVANQTEVPILHYANIILNTTIDDTSRYFSVPFAVADIKYNILGTHIYRINSKTQIRL